MANEQSDILWGVEDIAKAIGRTRRAAYHVLDAGELPARKVGGRWCASRQRLIAHLLGEAS